MVRKVFIALRAAGIAGQEKLKGIFRYLNERDVGWDITYIRQAIDFTPERIRKALKEGFDGYIISIPDTEKTAALLADSSVPTVVMDIHDPSLAARRANIAFIRNSPEEIGRAAANHLVNIGRARSYAFVHNASLMEWSVSRCQAFSRTLKDYGLFCHQIHELEDIRLLERPAAIFAANDDRGYDLLEFCRRHRLAVPEEVMVLGINNDTLICENCRPRLSSIQPDFEQEGYLAATLLEEMMNGGGKPSAPRTLYVGVKELVNRDSSATETTNAGKLVQKALAYIRRHYLDDIGVEDVVRHLGCSRRLADLRFRELQRTTIGETIISLRLEEVKRRLVCTRDPIEKISADCGYRNPNSLKNLFTRRFGMTMSAWRKRGV